MQGREPGERALARLIAERVSRRDVQKAAGLGAALAAPRRITAAAQPASTLTPISTELAHGLDEAHHVPPRYGAQVLGRFAVRRAAYDPLAPTTGEADG
jgi:hypothetical protein